MKLKFKLLIPTFIFFCFLTGVLVEMGHHPLAASSVVMDIVVFFTIVIKWLGCCEDNCPPHSERWL